LILNASELKAEVQKVHHDDQAELVALVEASTSIEVMCKLIHGRALKVAETHLTHTPFESKWNAARQTVAKVMGSGERKNLSLLPESISQTSFPVNEQALPVVDIDQGVLAGWVAVDY